MRSLAPVGGRWERRFVVSRTTRAVSFALSLKPLRLLICQAGVVSKLVVYRLVVAVLVISAIHVHGLMNPNCDERGGHTSLSYTQLHTQLETLLCFPY